MSEGVGLVARAAAQGLGLAGNQGVGDQDIAFSFFVEGVDEGALLVTQFGVEEAIFGLSHVEVRLVAKAGSEIDLDSLIDKPATLSIHHKYLPELRHFSGIVVEAERGDSGHHRTAYRLVLMPSLSRLDHGSDCRIFQEQSVPEIVAVVLKEHGIEDVDWQLTQPHDVREFLVCYRETHLAFIERILSEEGIFYYFRHGAKGKCSLVVCDNPYILEPCPGQKTLEYHGQASTVIRGVYCSALGRVRKLLSTGYRQRDYSFKQPHYAQEHLEGEGGDYELYDYPGRYKKSEVGQAFTRHKMEAVRVDSDLVHGIADAPLLVAGHGFELTHHPDGTLNRGWRLLTIRHEGVQSQALSEEGQGAIVVRPALSPPPLPGGDLVGASYGISRSDSVMESGGILPLNGAGFENECRYACAFTAQNSDQPYRPVQRAKPLVDGPQMAHVVGPQGEEIYTDEYGRVKVHFPWDRHKDPKAEDSSCWIRVASNWAGARWGHIAIPRIGQEVIVEFLEGDPDQPIITGRTYHEVNKPPYPLPANKTKMVIRSDTHKHGDGNIGFNELSFEDEKDREEVYVRAERNFRGLTRHDYHLSIIHDRHKDVGRHQSEYVAENKSISVGKNHHETIGEDVNYRVGQNQIESYGKDHVEKVGNILKQTIATDHLYEVGGKFVGEVAGSHQLTVGASINTRTRKHKLSATDSFEIMGPAGRILLDASGITLEAATINLKGFVNMGGGGSPAVERLSKAAREALPLVEECDNLKKG